MIWDPATSGTDRSHGVAGHIAREVDALCGSQLRLAHDDVQELANAVACFLEQCNEGPFVQSDYVTSLVSRALSALGETGAARRLFLFGTGLVRPSEWEFSGGQAVYVLDLKQISVHDGAGLELVFFSSIMMVLESIADVWDESSGLGVLGLRHVCSAAAALFGEGPGAKQVGALSQEVRDRCRHKFEQLRAERGWQQTPRIVDLDI